MLERLSDPGPGTVAAIFGVLTVLLAASGVFGEMHTALNATFKAKPSNEPISSLIRTRAASLGLVAALGFMLVMSLAASAGLSALSHVFQGLFAGKILLAVPLWPSSRYCSQRSTRFYPTQRYPRATLC